MDGGMGPAVTFPDEALVAEVAALEAPRAEAPVTFRWVPGIVYALAGALLGAAIFAGVSYATNAQFGIVSIIVGVLTGVGAANGGRSRPAQIVGAVAAAIGYFAGLWMQLIATVGWDKISHIPADMVAQVTWVMAKETFSTTSVLFLGIAVYEGWKIPRART